MTTISIALAVACIVWALWHRRITWTCKWERVATLAISFQGLGMLLASPFDDDGPCGVEYVLHSLTGLWGIDDLIGDVLFIGAAAGFAYVAISRALPSDRVARLSPRLIRLPAIAASVVLVAIYLLADFGDQPGALEAISVPMRIYWAVLAVVKIYLMLGAGMALWLLRRTSRHRTVANLYLFACATGIVACLARVAATFGASEMRSTNMCAAAMFGALWAAGFALAAAYSWHRKTRPFRPLPQAVS